MGGREGGAGTQARVPGGHRLGDPQRGRGQVGVEVDSVTGGPGNIPGVHHAVDEVETEREVRGEPAGRNLRQGRRADVPAEDRRTFLRVLQYLAEREK
ncbi:hypothetical protein [Nocardia neocaledoniensis]|uniref:hypothetical protein n=1 Tax=Nocardia neocaledoniensis TaxID=236511 RepID=UPI002453E61C|nr:hypothetical protein [Nocardia neocaledoniensis]